MQIYETQHPLRSIQITVAIIGSEHSSKDSWCFKSEYYCVVLKKSTDKQG